MISETKITPVCFHCGEDCETETIRIEEKQFCCQGCKTVYEILNKVELCDYYTISEKPAGINQRNSSRPEKFAFLDDENLQAKLIHFKDAEQSHATFYLPQMHCYSCIWLLEHLNKLDKNIVRSQVNFLKKELSLVFNHKHISLRKVVELLASIGYEPHFSLQNAAGKKTKTYDKTRVIKIGITGFCFGNIMLLSFPEYFSIGESNDETLKLLFSYLNVALALPVFFYCASEFFISAWKSFKQKFLNIDTPIALAILITFLRSLYEIITQTGAGYLDSMSGIVFFMLIGRFFQNKTYNTLAFNRDYTSYFPLGVTVLNEQHEETQIPVSNLKVGMRIKVYSGEIIPADCILFMGKAVIDYSFVSGEAIPVEKSIGEIIYAGGRQTGSALEMEVVKDVSQSYLTQLWNNEAFQKKEESKSYIHVMSKYFTLALFTVALSAAAYWYFHDATKIWQAVTSCLIVACPCALLLSATFTNGNMLRVLQKFGFYARHAEVIEQISNADEIVFDKTGTITEQQKSNISYSGKTLSEDEIILIKSLAAQSSHPLSRAVAQQLSNVKTVNVKSFEELKGQGIKGIVSNKHVMIGSANFVNADSNETRSSQVFLKIDDEILGAFSIQTQYRKGIKNLLEKLKPNYKISLLSGDNDAELPHLQPLFNSELLFNQLPQDKLDYIKTLQSQNKNVMMIGDGLNDAGALKQSDVGIVVSDNINNFSPACDAIMEGKSLSYFDEILNYCKQNKRIVNISFIVSILYNFVGLYYATRAELQPVIAAILMPASSISIILLTTGLSSLFALRFRSHR